MSLMRGGEIIRGVSLFDPRTRRAVRCDLSGPASSEALELFGFRVRMFGMLRRNAQGSRCVCALRGSRRCQTCRWCLSASRTSPGRNRVGLEGHRPSTGFVHRGPLADPVDDPRVVYVDTSVYVKVLVGEEPKEQLAASIAVLKRVSAKA